MAVFRDGVKLGKFDIRTGLSKKRVQDLAKKHASRPPSILARCGRRRPRLVHWLEPSESNPPVPQSAIDVVIRGDHQSIVRSDAGKVRAVLS